MIFSRTDFEILRALSANEIKTKYAGSYLGMLWGFLQPFITTLVLWIVLAFGFRSSSANSISWLVFGLLPWYYFSECLSSGTNSIIERSYLVKKIKFNIEIAIVSKLVTATFIHAIVILIYFPLALLSSQVSLQPTILLLPYFTACSFILALSIVKFTSTSVVYLRDINQIVGIFLQFMFWLTPIFWSPNQAPAWLQQTIGLNPIAYIIDGYRFAVGIEPMSVSVFAQKTAIFWIECLILYFISRLYFNRSKKFLADHL